MADERESSFVDEVREGFTLRQFQELVWRLEAEHTNLRIHNNVLTTKYQNSSEQQAEHLRHLHAEIDEKNGILEGLQATFSKSQQEVEDERQRAKDELELEKAKLAKQLTALQTHNEYLAKELEKLSQIRETKARMERELLDLKTKLKVEAEEHAKNVSAFDRKKVIEIDQLQRDMFDTMYETYEDGNIHIRRKLKQDLVDNLEKRTKELLEKTTANTIDEHRKKSEELHTQCKQTELLLARNQSLTEENAQLKRNLMIHVDIQKELARRSRVYQKFVKKMDQRNADEKLLETVLGLEETEVPQQESTLELEPEDSRWNVACAEELEQQKRQIDGIQSTLSMVRQEFAHYKRDHATLTQLQDPTTRLIIAALYELKEERERDPFPPAAYNEKAHWEFDTLNKRQKEYFYRVLLEKLNTSMCGSCFPAGACGSASVHSLHQLVTNGDGHCLSATRHSQDRAQGGMASRHSAPKDLMNKGCQTETEATDPCFKEGFWTPQSRVRRNDSSAVVSSRIVTSTSLPQLRVTSRMVASTSQPQLGRPMPVAAPKRRAIHGRAV